MMVHHRNCRRSLVLTVLILVFCWEAAAALGRSPNVVLIMTDDQGYGDLGVTGNPVIRTPNLDRFAGESVEVESFYVCPVCAPTRASLMTGRYNYRTGVTDTYLGRAMMHTDEVTLAEMLRENGYRTGIFGKWHLGDSYPMRPGDQGFEESLVHAGGGLCQPAGPPENTYFDPSLLHNGKRVKTTGYCSDVYTDAAIRFIGEHREEPFFIYLPFNCPHGPYQVAEKYSKPYEDLGMKPEDFPAVEGGHPLKGIPENTAKVYGMVENVDENLGRLFGKLDELGLAKNTIVIFLTDNGPNGARYNAGMKAHKGSVYEGGVRTCFFIRWPAKLEAGRKVDRIAAHIDVAPTLLEACGASLPEGVKLDGRSILPLLEGRRVDWPDRTLYFQWHRGDAPIRYRAFAARSQDYKLVHAGKAEPEADPADVRFELYDMRSDPLETNDVASEQPDVLRRMREGYEAWLDDVGRDHGYEAPRILIGTPHESRTVLTRQDWRGTSATWAPKGLGYWEIAVPRGGVFEIVCEADGPKRPGVAHLKLQGIELEQALEPGTARYRFPAVELKASPAERLETWIEEEGVGKPYGVRFVYVERCE
ncbi:MAG: arylsulfatase [Planctomycetes bacterium]|nr:arylsulfatase [Planctomycetota bacterium]